MTALNALLQKQIVVQISGIELIKGILIDAGKDILVLFNGRRYLYIPLLHVHQIQLNTNKSEYVDLPGENVAKEQESLSYRDILINAKGAFTEIYVSRNLSFHGYITNVLSDYVAFYSPIYKIIFIPISHLKWLIPYHQNTTPYTLSNENLTVRKSPLHLKVNPSNIPKQFTLKEQLKWEEGKFVIFDGGVDPLKVGLLRKVESNLAELVLANGESVSLNLSHIKSVHLP